MRAGFLVDFGVFYTFIFGRSVFVVFCVVCLLCCFVMVVLLGCVW